MNDNDNSLNSVGPSTVLLISKFFSLILIVCLFNTRNDLNTPFSNIILIVAPISPAIIVITTIKYVSFFSINIKFEAQKTAIIVIKNDKIYPTII